MSVAKFSKQMTMLKVLCCDQKQIWPNLFKDRFSKTLLHRHICYQKRKNLESEVEACYVSKPVKHNA